MGEALEKAKKARIASRELAQTSSSQRCDALNKMADALIAQTAQILEANEADMNAAREKGTPGPLLDRLMLSHERIDGIADGLRQVAAQPEVLGEVLEGSELYNGLRMIKYRVPLGVVAMIYEARPNVTADAAGLCIKTGNACILRGGSLAQRSCLTISHILAEAAASAGLPVDCIQSIEDPGREATDELMSLAGLVDVLIPRGGAGLIQHCVKNATVPVIETGTGNCHVYIHKQADPAYVEPIIMNAKTQRPVSAMPARASSSTKRSPRSSCPRCLWHLPAQASSSTPMLLPLPLLPRTASKPLPRPRRIGAPSTSTWRSASSASPVSRRRLHISTHMARATRRASSLRT